MDLGVWMSRGVLAHKRDSAESLQAWNLKSLPDELSRPPEPHRLFIAVEGSWRGHFVLEPWVNCNPADAVRHWTLLFNPASWTEIPPEPAPPRDRKFGYTIDVPALPLTPNGGTR
jgi:hypothetical protein